MLRRTHRAQRGQALTELALAAPVVVGLFALALQGGIVLDDQVNLQHYAYEGAQWAVANRAAATHDDIVKHIQAQMCGTDISNPNPIPSAGSQNSRYCRDSSLQILVSKVGSVTGMNQPGGDSPFGPLVVDALAATCQAWDLKVTPATSPASPLSAAQNTGSATFTVFLVGPSGSGLPSGPGLVPLVTLTVSPLPSLNQGTPYFNPPTITVIGAASTSSTLTIYPGNYTTTGLKDLTITGTDQCGGNGQGSKEAWVQVTGSSAPVIVGVPNFSVNGLLPLCLATGGGSLTINGQGFVGATVKVGGADATVTASSSTQLTVTVPALPSGASADVAVTVGGVTFTLASAVTIGGCPATPAPVTNGTSIPCFFAGQPTATSGETEYIIQITWNETLIIPWITNNASLSASQRAFCQ